MRTLRQIREITSREWRLIVGDSRLRSVVLVAPFIYALLMCAVYFNHSVDELPIAVHQPHSDNLTRQLLRMVDASSKLQIQQHSPSLADAQSRLEQGEVVAVLAIPKDFSLQLKRGHDTTVTALVDAASMVEGNTAASAINRVVATFSAGVEVNSLVKGGHHPQAALEKMMPVKLDLRTLYNPSFNYSNFMVPGILMTILQQVILMGLALSFTGEKERGTFGPLLRRYPSNFAILVGKGLPYLGINFVVAEIYLRVVFPLNNIPMEGDWRLMIPFTFLFVLTLVCWGLWVSALCKTQLFATQLLMFLAMPSFVLSGFTWPLRAMPEPVQAIAHALPMTHFIGSFRRIYLAGAGFSEVAEAVLILVGFTLANGVLAFVILGRLRKNAL